MRRASVGLNPALEGSGLRLAISQTKIRQTGRQKGELLALRMCPTVPQAL